MWRGSDQESLAFDNSFLQPQPTTRTNQHAHFSRQHQTSQASSEQHNSECMQAQLSEHLNSSIGQSLPPALLSEAGQGQATDLPNLQLDLDNATLSAALGLGDNFLAQFHRNLHDPNGQSSSELNAILAASLGVLPGPSSINHLLGPEACSSSFAGSNTLPHALPQSSLTTSKDLQKSASNSSHAAKSPADIEERAESDEHSDGEGSAGTKRKGPVTEEDRKRRRQEINRQSARRIRERRSLEMDRLKHQNAMLQQQHAVLLRYASGLAREKNVLVQRTIELTERWNQTAAENLELRERVKGVPSASKAAAATTVYQPLQPQSSLPDDHQQIVPQSRSTHGNSPAYAP